MSWKRSGRKPELTPAQREINRKLSWARINALHLQESVQSKAGVPREVEARIARKNFRNMRHWAKVCNLAAKAWLLERGHFYLLNDYQ